MEALNLNENRYESKVIGIKGWGSDLDRAKRPGVPKEANEDTTLTGFHDPVAVKQEPAVEILLTNERGSLPPVFSSVAPPRGLSGVMRRLAFRYSENTMTHWLTLMAADRVDMVEGWLEDLRDGKAPMILPRQEYRTLDHLRRIRDQGVKNRTDAALVAGAAITVGGLVAGAIYLASRAAARREH